MNKFPSSYAAGSIDEARAQAKDRLVASIMFGQGNRVFDIETDLRDIRQYKQTQRSLEDQLADLRAVANKLGLYDAADFLKGR